MIVIINTYVFMNYLTILGIVRTPSPLFHRPLPRFMAVPPGFFKKLSVPSFSFVLEFGLPDGDNILVKHIVLF